VSYLEEIWHHPYGEAWSWKHHNVGLFSATGTGRLVRIKENLNGTYYTEILDENLLQSTQDLRLEGSPSNKTTFHKHTDNHKHTDKSTQEWPEPGLEADRTSLGRPENSCAVITPIQPDRA
jgi:hypothetical protein